MSASSAGAQGKKNLPVSATSTIIAIVCLLLTPGHASAQDRGSNPGSSHESERAAQVRALNNSILQLHGQMQENASGATGTRGQAAMVLVQRAAALQALIQEDPHAALTFAFSPDLLADLAEKFPDSVVQLESHVTVTGRPEHWIADYPGLKSSRSIWRLNTAGRNLNLHFAGKEPANLTTDQLLQLTGVVAGSEMAVESSNHVQSSSASNLNRISDLIMPRTIQQSRLPIFVLIVFALILSAPRLTATIWLARRQAISVLRHFAIYALVFAFLLFSTPSYAQNACTTTGVQKTIVILATFSGVTPPSNLTAQNTSEMFFGATAPSVTNYWQEASYGTTSAAGNVFGWYTLTGSYSNCQLTNLQSDAMSAAAASGVNFQNYDRIVVVFPDTLGCGWSGFSSIGCSSLTTPSGTITASSSYITAANATVQVATHELGHGLGLSHASSRGFADSNGNPITLGPLGATGTLTEYGDKFSTMACCETNVGGEYGAPHKAEILAWLLPDTGYQTVQTSGTYNLEPYENPGGLKAIKVQRGTGNNAWLWLEFRQADGYYDPASFPGPVNSFLPPQPYSGALIHYEDSISGLYTHLINYNPNDGSFFSPALVAGQTWKDPYSDLTLSVNSATANGLTVSVNYSGVPSCASFAPTVVASPLDPSIYAGESAVYTVSVTSSDSPGCGTSTINLASSEPSGWSTSFSSSAVTLGPGQSASVTMSKGAPSGTPPGTYAVNLDASNNSASGAGTANATVMALPSLGVSLSVPGTSFSRPGTVPVTASVTSGGVSASGASVTFTLKTPSGSTTTQTASTSSSGMATWNYKLNQRSQTGSYSVTAQVALGSGTKKNASSTQTVASNTLSFSVQ